MSAVFPHDAVVQRYLHTGKRHSPRKAVVASVLGVIACVVVAATLPAASPKSGAEKSVTAEQAKPVPAAQPFVQDVASQTAASTSPPQIQIETSTATNGAAMNQPNARPVPSPVLAMPAPQPDAPAVAVPPPATSDHIANVSPPKEVDTKLARKASHRLTAAERRNRLARARAGAAQPTLVRVYDLPDGRRIYQRVTTGDEARLNFPGGELRRVYLAPVNRGVN